MTRRVLVLLAVAVPDGDDRPPTAIAAAILDAIEVGADDDSVRDLAVTIADAEAPS